MTDFHYGETDLLESALNRPATLYTSVLVLFILGLLALGTGLLLSGRTSDAENPITSEQITPSQTTTLSVITVTAGPPSATASFTPSATFTPSITPTPLPCVYTIPSGGSLYEAILNCGHRSPDILPTVLALNNLPDASALQVGQQVFVPWPTATLDPNAPPTATNTPASGASSDNTVLAMLQVDTSIDAFAPTATATLPAGVMWHSVQSGDNIVVISVQYNANAKVLSELNPEVDFARCEFGERFGGPECLVQLYPGQLLRVPAPSPTPTLSPTPDPNATATPTATPTYNKPSIVSPPDRQFFNRNDIITLRWVPSATLNVGEAYRIDVEDLTTGARFIAFTQDISFIIPPDWQGQDDLRHEYRWTVGIVQQLNTEVVNFQTDPRTFVWQGAE